MTITGTNSAGTSSTTATVTVWTLTVMSNPIMSDWADLEVQGAQRLRARVGSAAGVYLMQIHDGTRMETVRIVHP